MQYCLSDIHGEYGAWRRMLEKIGLREEDTLYVLGDVVDRGPDGIRILREMMGMPNVIPILGNHEFMAAWCLRFLMREVTDENITVLENEALEGLRNWFADGGKTTLDSFLELGEEERTDILDYLSEFTLYEETSAGGRDYLLVHAGLENFRPDRPLEDYNPWEMLFARPDYSVDYFPDVWTVTGHTPTALIPGNPSPGRIYRRGKHIAIDCGCTFGGTLGAICLDTDQEFYTD